MFSCAFKKVLSCPSVWPRITASKVADQFLPKIVWFVYERFCQNFLIFVQFGSCKNFFSDKSILDLLQTADSFHYNVIITTIHTFQGVYYS